MEVVSGGGGSEGGNSKVKSNKIKGNEIEVESGIKKLKRWLYYSLILKGQMNDTVTFLRLINDIITF